MPFDVEALLQILPEFAIAGIISILFYMVLNRSVEVTPSRPQFIVVRGDTVDELLAAAGTESGKDSPAVNSTPFSSEGNSDALKGLRESQMIVVTVSLWILLSLILLPTKDLNDILPQLPLNSYFIVYAVLAALFLISVVTTIVTRIKVTGFTLILLLIAGAGISYLAFYLPSMQWVNNYVVLLRAVVIYCASAATVFVIYFLSRILDKGHAVRLSIVGTFGLYAFTVILLVWNMAENIF